MLYANEDIFNISYNSELDRLEINNQKSNNKIKKKNNENKIIIVLVILFGIFSIMNSILIYSFMELLKNI